jgi:hypothetical protein
MRPGLQLLAILGAREMLNPLMRPATEAADRRAETLWLARNDVLLQLMLPPEDVMAAELAHCKAIQESRKLRQRYRTICN